MFDAALKALPQSGGRIELEKGTYLVSRPIVLPENSCIIGVNMSDTIIRLVPKATPFPSQGSAKGILSCKKNARVTIHSLTVDGNSDEQWPAPNLGHKFYAHGRYGVSAERCNYFWTRNVRATNMELYGFFTRGVAGGGALYYAFHEACQADRNRLDGIEFRNVMYASVYNSIVRNNKEEGISIAGNCKHNMLKNVRISNSGKYGVHLWKKDGKAPLDTMISNVHIDASGEAGIYHDSARDTFMAGGTIEVKKKNKDGTESKSSCYKVRKSSNFHIKGSGCDGVHFDGEKDSGEKSISGIVSSGAFCRLECGQCGEDGCHKHGENKSCCVNGVKAMKKICDKDGPPCSFST